MVVQGFLSFSLPLPHFHSTYHGILKDILWASHYVNLFIYIFSFYPHSNSIRYVIPAVVMAA